LRFEDKYVDAEKGFYSSSDGVHLSSDDCMPCFTCGYPTKWTDKKIDVPVCSLECLEQARNDLSDYVSEDTGFDALEDFLFS